MRIGRRTILGAAALAPAASLMAACASSPVESTARDDSVDYPWSMPAEEDAHEATWMCLPGRTQVWGSDLDDVQQAIARLALTIAQFEPVRMLARPGSIERARDLVGNDVEIIEAPVDDLWARDTLPLFLVSDDGGLAAGRVRFNGWGDKQIHSGDATLAGIVADILEVQLIDTGLVGEGGGLETDGHGTLLAARSSWVNDNRNPGVSEENIGSALVATLGADRMLWVDGVAGEDITDGHIDTLARFADPSTIVREIPSYVEPGEVWYDLAVATLEELESFATLDGDPYDLITLRQPETTRRANPDFLPSYVNYYVCNGAVITAQFGDTAADAAAAETIEALYPGRTVVTIDIDAVAAGGGGVHCATQQQPMVS